MKPKPLFKLSLFLIIATISLFFLEHLRKSNNLNTKSNEVSYNETDAFKASNNDFIFFGSISKYLMVSFTK